MADSVLAAAAALRPIPRVLSLLSTCIFPDGVPLPMAEEAMHAGPPHASNAAYAYAKRWLDTLSRAYRSEYGAPFFCAVPTNIYGPRDNYHLEDGHVIPALVHRAWLARRDGAPLVVAGTGAPLRQFVESRDLARLLLLALRVYGGETPIILSADAAEEISIGDVARAIAEATGLAPERIVFKTERADGQFRKTADNARMRALLAEHDPAFAFTPVKAGIAEAVRWFAEHHEEARK